MHPLIPVAAATLVVTLAYTWRTSRRHARLSRRRTLVLIGAGLPLSLLVNLAVKSPLAALASDLSGVSATLSPSTPWWFLAFALLLAPVTEELVKLLPVALVARRTDLADRAVALFVGLIAGLSFGVGEVLFLAARIVVRGQYADTPWFGFTGFLAERVLAVLIHGLATALAVYLWRARGLRLPVAVLPSIAAHTVTNLFPLLALAKITGGATAMLSASLVPVLVLLAMMVVFERIRATFRADTGDREVLWQRAGS